MNRRLVVPSRQLRKQRDDVSASQSLLAGSPPSSPGLLPPTFVDPNVGSLSAVQQQQQHHFGQFPQTTTSSSAHLPVRTLRGRPQHARQQQQAVGPSLSEGELRPEALQFMPAFSKNAHLPGSSWDEEEEGDVEEKKDEKAVSVISAASTTLAFKARQYKHARKQNRLANQASPSSPLTHNTSATSRSTTSGPSPPSFATPSSFASIHRSASPSRQFASPPFHAPASPISAVGRGGESSGRRGSRITRLAAIFNRAASPEPEEKPRSNSQPKLRNANHPSNQHFTSVPSYSPRQERSRSAGRSTQAFQPTSPANSSGSSGYVGWPGTQDKRGATVTLQSSNEEGSSLSGGNNAAYSWTGGSSTNDRWKAAASKAASKSKSVVGGSSPHLEHRRTMLRQRPSPISTASLTASSPRSPEGSSSGAGEYYLAEALADARAAARSPQRRQGRAFGQQRFAPHPQHDITPVTSNLRAAPMPSRTFVLRDSNRNWGDVGADFDLPSSPSTAFSKTSSAYFQEKDLNPLAYPDLAEDYNPYGTRARAAASVLRSHNAAAAAAAVASNVQPPTEQALAVQNHLTPPTRTYSAGSKGFRGLLDKTKEVPSLMDDAIDSDNSSRATSSFGSSRRNANTVPDEMNESDVFDGISKESDVFDNMSKSSSQRKLNRTSSRVSYPDRIEEEDDHNKPAYNFPNLRPKASKPPAPPVEPAKEEPVKVVLLGGGLTAIQSSVTGFVNRQTAVDYDDQLTNSDIDQDGYIRTPSFHAMMNAGTNNHDSSILGMSGNFGSSSSSRSRSSSSDGSGTGNSSFISDPQVGSSFLDGSRESLSQYYIDPSVMKKVLRKFRAMSNRVNSHLTLAQFERSEDENKAFALFEMRSRIMEKDIERGLERRGGTVVVDDLVTTPYSSAAHRIRDAVIVSKAWRDGASPRDVVNTALLTRRAERTFYIRRWGIDKLTGKSGKQRYFWEPVRWHDDTDFLLYRCPSLGPRSLRGFEMFTIGDCQSILLKLTNERCMELRKDLNRATKFQIEAEELMKEDGDVCDHGMMTDSEMRYLTAMEVVKTVSKQLVVAEQSFTLVRDRIEKLIARYEVMLVKMDHESNAGASSIMTYESSYISEHDSQFYQAEEEREAALWARRAKRAELKAEVDAREALLSRQNSQHGRAEKYRELETLKQRLNELQSDASDGIDRHHSAALSKNFNRADFVKHGSPQQMPPSSRLPPQTLQHPPADQVDQAKIDSVKQRFRDRMAAKKKQAPIANVNPLVFPVRRPRPPTKPSGPGLQRSLLRAAGEEMFQHLDFYERSLKAVQQ